MKVIIIFFLLSVLVLAQPDTHPRLLVQEQDLPGLRAKISNSPSTINEYYSVMRGLNNDFMVNTPPLNYTEYGIYSNLAFGSLVENDPGFDPYLAEQWAMLSINKTLSINRRQNNWSQRLEINFITPVLALVYDYAYEFLTTTQKEDLLNEIIYYMDIIRTWVYSQDKRIKYSNHIDMLSSSLGLAAISIKGENLNLYSDEQFEKDIDSVKVRIFKFPYGTFHTQWNIDGSTKEGPSYQILHGATVNLFLCALSKYENYNWFDPPDPQYAFIKPTLINVINHLIYHVYPKPHHTYSRNDMSFIYYNDSNGPGLHCMIGDYLMLAQKYNYGPAVWLYEQTLASPTNLNSYISDRTNHYANQNTFLLPIIYYAEYPSTSPEGFLEYENYFPDDGLFFWRTGWDNENDLQFMFQSRPAWHEVYPGEYIVPIHHTQPDNGQFMLNIHGEFYICDTEDKYKPRNNNYINMFEYETGLYQGEAHGKNERSWWDRHGTILEYFKSASINYVEADNKKAFSELLNQEQYEVNVRLSPSEDLWWVMPVQKVKRAVQYIKQKDGLPLYFIITDDIQKDETVRQYNWFVHTMFDNLPDTKLEHKFDISSNPVKLKRKDGSEPQKYLDLYVAHPSTFTPSLETVYTKLNYDELLEGDQYAMVDGMHYF